MRRFIPPAVRRKIIDFDPATASESVSAFCRGLGVSRRSFYVIRQRYEQESTGALRAKSSAPVTPHRTYGADVVQLVKSLREELESAGRDAGPKSVRFVGIQRGLFPDGQVPSVSTVARMLKAAGLVRANPRKRPKGPMVRFTRDYAMELWQLDAFEFQLFTAPGVQDGHRICIYQILDDASRFDVGSQCFAQPENSQDARTVVAAAIAAYGAPQELLSDNSTAFAQLRRGSVGPLELLLASHGCMPISSLPGHPGTHGKAERSHQTMQYMLIAQEPTSLEEARTAVARFRQVYNHERAHQALSDGIPMTPAQAWELLEHRPATETIDPAVLEYRAKQYAARKPKRPKKQAPPLPEQPPQPEPLPGQPSMELVFVTWESKFAYYRSFHIGLPSSHANRYYYRQITPDEYILWDPDTGEIALSFPLPLRALPPKAQYILSHAIEGVYLQDAPELWHQRNRANQIALINNSTQLE